MKTCLLCGEVVGVDVQTCPRDGEASWSLKQVKVLEALEVMPALEEVAPAPKRGLGRPRKSF